MCANDRKTAWMACHTTALELWVSAVLPRVAILVPSCRFPKILGVSSWHFWFLVAQRRGSVGVGYDVCTFQLVSRFWPALGDKVFTRII